MAFLIYKPESRKGVEVLKFSGESFQLGGYQLIYKAWVKKGKPMDKGWKITSQELIELKSSGKESYSTMRLIIDFDPHADWRIGLVELLEVIAFTYKGEAPQEVEWTPLMLRLKNVFYEEYEEGYLTPARMSKMKAEIIPTHDSEIVEFLYLKGDKYGWSWGRNGSTNAVFLEGKHREYFRQYF